MPVSRRFVLTADDFALTSGVSAGILDLLEAGRITAAGAMTNRPHWRNGAAVFSQFRGKADLGLHFNLTCGAPLTRMSSLAPGGTLPRLPAILRAGLLGILPEAEIAAELAAQIDAFADAMGQMPDFIDGHQHVHALPGVRRVLATVLPRLFPGQKPYLRDPAETFSAIRARKRHVPKAAMLASLARPFGPAMHALGFDLNEGFSGYSAFAARGDYARDFSTYLVACGPKPLIMCHPGYADDELRGLDPATGSRENELAFFLSPRFEAICAEAGFTPARFSEL
jgi:chitin disaccharide deacetylase